MSGSYFMLKMLRSKKKKTSQKSTSSEPRTLNPDITKMCRICLKEGIISIFHGDGNGSEIYDAVCIFGDIKIIKNDVYPKFLCNSCFSLLQNAILFRKTAKETDHLLHQKDESLEQTYEEEFNEYAFSTNTINHSNVKPTKAYSCKICKATFSSSEKLIKHKASKQHKNTRIKCVLCQRLLTIHSYKNHLVRHQSASHLICEVCGKLYRKDNLVRHLQLHSYELPFKCQSCPYRGRFLESLRIHMRTHTGEKPFSCDNCQLHFLTRSNLNRHLLTHKRDRPYKCVECSRGYYTKRDLDTHFKIDHAGIKDFICKICGSKYGTRKGLMRHELRIHKRNKMAKGRIPLYLQSDYRLSGDGYQD